MIAPPHRRRVPAAASGSGEGMNRRLGSGVEVTGTNGDRRGRGRQPREAAFLLRPRLRAQRRRHRRRPRGDQLPAPEVIGPEPVPGARQRGRCGMQRRPPDGGRYPPKLSGSGMSLVDRKAPDASVACVQAAAARWSPGDVSMEASGASEGHAARCWTPSSGTRVPAGSGCGSVDIGLPLPLRRSEPSNVAARGRVALPFPLLRPSG